MNLGDFLIQESLGLLWLIPAGIAILVLTRWFQGRPVFTDRDWRFLLGHSPAKIFTARLWLRFAELWLAVVLVGVGVSFYVLPYGLARFFGTVLLAVVAVLFITPKWL